MQAANHSKSVLGRRQIPAASAAETNLDSC